MSYELRKDDEGDPIECEVCDQRVPLEEFNQWMPGLGSLEKRLTYQCEFCANTHSCLTPVEKTGHRGMAILFHEIRALRDELRQAESPSIR